jgi:hypothetical protein
MKPQELFGVLLKAMGVWELVAGLEPLPNYVLSFPETHNETQLISIFVANMLSYSGMRILFGCLLFFRADWFARKVYPTVQPEATP